MTKVALSGAGGQVGGVLRPRLLARGVKLRSGGGRSPLTPLSEAEEVMHGDLRDPEVVGRLLQGVDVLIHLAGTSVERPLTEIMENNLRALHEIYEGARRHGVKRIVFASSNQGRGFTAKGGQYFALLGSLARRSGVGKERLGRSPSTRLRSRCDDALRDGPRDIC